MPTFVLQIHRPVALRRTAIGAAAPQAATAAPSLDLLLGRESVTGAAAGDHVAATLRDLALAALSLAEGRGTRALVPLYDTPWELCFVAGDNRIELSLYRTGALPEVRVLDEGVSVAEIAGQLRAAVDTLGDTLGDASRNELRSLLDRLDAQRGATLRAATSGASTMVRWRSRPRMAADGSGAASIVAVTLQAVLTTREGKVRNEIAQSDLHALLARGRLGVEVRGQRIDLGAGFVFLQFERLVALCRPLLEARAARRAMNVRAQVGGAVIGLRLTVDDTLALSIARGAGGTVTVPALDARAFVSPVAEGALALAAAIVRCDRGLARNLRLRALRTEARALRRWLRDLDRDDTKINDDPARYRAVEAGAEPTTLDLSAAARLRYVQRWRAEIEGLDLAGTFISGPRIVVPGARELCAIDRASGSIAWTAPASRAATVAAGEDILRVTTRGEAELRSGASGEVLWNTRVVPRVGAASPPVVVAQSGVARIALLAEGERRLVALDLRTGEARWTLTARHSGSFRVRRVGRLAVVVSGDAMVTAVDLASGELVWRHSAALPFSAAPLVHGERVIVLAGEPGRGPAAAHVLGGLTGETEHVLHAGMPACAPPVATGEVLAIPCANREEGVVLVGFALDSGEECFRVALDATAAGVSRPATIAVDGLFVTNLPTGRAVAVEAATGAVRWTWNGRTARPDDVPRRMEPLLRAGALFLPQASLAVLRPRDGVAMADIDACDLVPDMVRVDEQGAIYVGEESGHLGCFEPGARLRVLRPV